MRYLRKTETSPILQRGLEYPRDARELREALLEEQSGFCAYTERYVGPTDAMDLEHFDPRKKNTKEDDYFNWYAVLTWLNRVKPKKIERFLPILPPSSSDLPERIAYRKGYFEPVHSDDQEARNLIEFLCWNRRELWEERRNHVKRIRIAVQAEMKGPPATTPNEAWRRIVEWFPASRSFATALQAELGLPVEI